ncbi:hypothetical protein [Chromobacterium sp. IIBBL 290-4]|uniref:hypothetical protein n=1 Tax=Chromobacterium sp. IIBBL 290-4 TaxID=2953890 RepID=UPI0020B86E2E|nr:hypothetical protein [Chromobacterium sp. IIBBL 290-4]UTH75161.1 hypothetical protein NKT35_03410 [Chromobacterium sp. IIBBL 290-4]
MGSKAILIGGVLPAVLLGTATVLMKLSMRAGSSIMGYLAVVGLTVCVIGLFGMSFLNQDAGTLKSAGFAVAMGAAWSIAIATMAYGISRLNIPVSIIAPLTNSNALIALMLSSVIFRE